MRIRVSYNENMHIWQADVPQVLIGRSRQNKPVDVDLSPDPTVSHQHARIWLEESQYWIEDLESKLGTHVSGKDIRGLGRWPLKLSEEIRIGRTNLVVEQVLASPAHTLTNEDFGEVGKTLDASQVIRIPLDSRADMESRLKLLYELPLEFAHETCVDSVLQKIVERVVQIIPGAVRGALMVKDQKTGELLLRAHLPLGNPAVSLTLARRAMEKEMAFTWDKADSEPSASMRQQKIASAMYAPMLWKGDALGVICVDNCKACAAYHDGDLQLMTALGQHAAMAVAVHTIQEDLRQSAVVLSRLLTNFSPKVRAHLLEKARHGRLRVGGEKSEVTVLFSDIRGFTGMSADMEAEDVVDMLNSYFPALIDPIFKHDGTIDKFVGDAILAVFGTPEADAQQHDKAVRAALEMQAALQELNKLRQIQGQPICEIGIGVHCGEVLHGFIGSAERMEFTVIGNAVNRTERYCAGAQAGEILISPELYQRVWRMVLAEPTTIATKHEGDFPAFRIKGLAP